MKNEQIIDPLFRGLFKFSSKKQRKIFFIWRVLASTLSIICSIIINYSLIGNVDSHPISYFISYPDLWFMCNSYFYKSKVSYFLLKFAIPVFIILTPFSCEIFLIVCQQPTSLCIQDMDYFLPTEKKIITTILQRWMTRLTKTSYNLKSSKKRFKQFMVQ